MTKNQCCVLSPEDRMQWDLRSDSYEECPFPLKDNFNLVEYNGKYYCPLHLPNESPSKSDVDTTKLLLACLNLNFFNFRFIKLRKFNLYNVNTEKPLWINFSIINELIIENCTFNHICIEKTKLLDQTKFLKCQAGFLTLENVNSFCNNFILELSTNEINIRKCTFSIKTIPEENHSFIDSILSIIEKQKVSISGDVINRLNIDDSIFHTHLSIDTNNIANTTFSGKNQFGRVPSIITHTPEKFDGAFSMPILKWNSIKHGLKQIYRDDKERYQSQLSGECDRLKNLYHIASIKLLYDNESNYYELMHKCLENNPEIPLVNKYCSKLYGVFGGYGVSISRPLISIILLMGAFYILFCWQTNSPSLAFDYLIYPIKLFDDIKPSSKCSKLILLFYSLCLYTLATFLILSLRWVFKKR